MEKYQSITVYSKPPPLTDLPPTDFVARIIEGDDISKTSKMYYIAKTASFVRKTGNLLIENKILKNVAKNLWKNHLYNQEYTSYLLGTYSKEDFLKIAEQYAETFDVDIDKASLKFSFTLISSILNQPLTSNDFSIMLNVESSYIESNLLESHQQIEMQKKE